MSKERAAPKPPVTCRTCRYATPKTPGVGEPQAPVGLCRRNAPMAVPETMLLDDARRIGLMSACWPDVDLDADWCGEHPELMSSVLDAPVKRGVRRAEPAVAPAETAETSAP